MEWINRFQLFLFDFDGLLVNTEELHFQAYVLMCARRGYTLNWSFEQFSNAAHHHSTGLRDAVYAHFPQLEAEEPHWPVLYEEKKQAFLDLVNQGAVSLMPGAADLLYALQEANINRAVITHSAQRLIETIQEHNPTLQTIPHWITRECYENPKPHPECYLKAISQFAKPGDRIIGFEDSPRGLHALMETPALSVLICPPNSLYLENMLKQNVKYYASFTNISDANAPG